MSRLEDHFKDSLHRAVANEPPVVDAWDRFEGRARRDRRVRFAAALASVAVIAAASALAIPQLLPESSPVITPPTESPTPDPHAGWKEFVNDVDLYRLRYPADWRVTNYEGVHEVLAPGQPATQAGEPTMAVTLALLGGNEQFDSPEWRARGYERSTRPDGRPFVWNEERRGDGWHTVTYRIDWSAPCTFQNPQYPERPVCDIANETLVVQILAGNGELWSSYEETARRIVDSIEHLGLPIGSFPTSD
jgi:hypothetical protein